MNTRRTATDHIRFLKSTLLKCCEELASQDKENKPNSCHHALPAIPINWSKPVKFFRSPKRLEVLPLPPSRKRTFLSWKDSYEPYE